MSRTNYIFIDFENVPESDLDRIANRPVKLILILGEKQRSLPVSLVQKLLQYREQVALVQTKRGGKNALDSVLAYYVGLQAKADPDGFFHILSRDKGFDPLVAHLREHHTPANRHAAFSEIPVLMNLEERVKYMAGYLIKHRGTRPRKRTGLVGQIQHTFCKALSSEEISDTIKGLIAGKVIVVSDKQEIAYGAA